MPKGEKEQKVYFGKIKSVDEQKMTVEAIVSDETIDRYGDVILADAWKKRIGNYKGNSVLLSSHDYDGLTNIIGQAERVYVKDGALHAKFKYFVGDGNAEADWAWKLASKYKMAAFSVGFLPHDWEDNSYDDPDVKAGKKPCRKYTDVELLEISQVTVPANPKALMKSFVKSIGTDDVRKSIIKEFGEIVLKEVFTSDDFEEEEVMKELVEKLIATIDTLNNKVEDMAKEIGDIKGWTEECKKADEEFESEMKELETELIEADKKKAKEAEAELKKLEEEKKASEEIEQKKVEDIESEDFVIKALSDSMENFKKLISGQS